MQHYRDQYITFTIEDGRFALLHAPFTFSLLADATLPNYPGAAA